MSKRPAPSRVDSVPLANARNELATLESTNAVIQTEMCRRDAIYEALTARDGRKLASLYEKVVAPLILARIARYHDILARDQIPVSERMIDDAQLELIETTVGEGRGGQNDDMSRCLKQVFLICAVVREPQLLALFLCPPPPAHPFPGSAEARAEAERVPVERRSLVNETTLVATLQQDWLPAYINVVSGRAQRVNLVDWVVERTVAYIVRLPLT